MIEYCKEGTRSLIPKWIPDSNLPVKGFKWQNYSERMLKCQ